MRKGTRLVALVAALPQYCSAVEGCLRRADVEEASRILEASGRSRLKANLELGRRVLKLLKKSVLSVSSSMRHTPQRNGASPCEEVTTHSPATTDKAHVSRLRLRFARAVLQAIVCFEDIEDFRESEIIHEVLPASSCTMAGRIALRTARRHSLPHIQRSTITRRA